MVVSALVDIHAPGARRIKVRYGDGQGANFETPELVPDPDGRVTAVLLGLRPGMRNQIDVEASVGDRTLHSERLSFTADPLPPDVALPEVKVVTDDGSARGYLLGEFRTSKGKMATLLDRHGRVFWYRPLVAEALGAFLMLPNGHLIVWNMPARLYDEVDLSGIVLRRWMPDPSASQDGADGHEFLALSDDRAMVIGWRNHPADPGRRFPKIPSGAERRDNTVVEFDVAGASRVIWESYPDVGVDEVRPPPGAPVDPGNFEVAHMNAIDLSPDGKFVVVTCREMEQVLGIDRTTGKVRWRLGGKRSDFRITDDPLGGFNSPHDARVLPGNRLRVFDNGNRHKPPESRVVVYELDEVKKTARLVWEYRHDPPFFTWFGGSARALPNDRLLINFTWERTVIEIDKERRVHWEINVPDSAAYRIEWVPTLYR